MSIKGYCVEKARQDDPATEAVMIKKRHMKSKNRDQALAQA